MRTSTKAEGHFYYILSLLIVLISLVLLIWIFSDIKDTSEGLSDYSICKNSNIANQKLKLKLDNFVINEQQGNRCTTNYVTVPEKEELPYIANKLASCWDMYLEGKAQIFDTKDNNYCAFCSVLTFEGDQPISGLSSYLAQNKVPWSSQTSYIEYLKGAKMTKEELSLIENTQLQSLTPLDPSTPYAVIFSMEKNANPDGIVDASSLGAGIVGLQISSTIGGMGCLASKNLYVCLGVVPLTITGGLIGYALGSSYDPDFNSHILLLPYKKEVLEQLKCTQLEGQDYLDIRK